MKMLEKYTTVQSLVDGMSTENTAQLAGEILGEATPTRENLLTFWTALKPDVRAELAERLQEDEFIALTDEDANEDEDDDESDDDEKD